MPWDATQMELHLDACSASQIRNMHAPPQLLHQLNYSQLMTCTHTFCSVFAKRPQTGPDSEQLPR